MAQEGRSVWSEIKKYEEILESDPASLCFVQLAGLFCEIEFLDDAIMVAEKGLELNPDCAEGYLALGTAQFEVGERDNRRKSLERVVSLSPENRAGWKLLGRLHLEENEPELAEMCLRELLRLNPADPESLAAFEKLTGSGYTGCAEEPVTDAGEELADPGVAKAEGDFSFDEEPAEMAEVEDEPTVEEKLEAWETFAAEEESDAAVEAAPLTSGDGWSETVEELSGKEFLKFEFAAVAVPAVVAQELPGEEPLEFDEEFDEDDLEEADIIEDDLIPLDEESDEPLALPVAQWAEAEESPEVIPISWDPDMDLWAEGEGEWSEIGSAAPTEEPTPEEVDSFRDPLKTATLAEIYLAQGFHDQALSIYRELSEASPDSDELLRRIAEIEQLRELSPAVADSPEPIETVAVEAPNEPPQEEAAAAPASIAPPPETGEERAVATFEQLLQNIEKRRGYVPE